MLRGFYLTFGTRIDIGVNQALQAAAARLLEDPLPGVTDVVPAFTTVYVEFDERRVAAERVRRWAEACATSVATATEPHRVSIPVDYRGADLHEVARRTGLSEPQVVERHSGRDYHVFALGFTPGFPYLGLVDPILRLPRRATPRTRVPAHSVAIANEQTGVYPSASPGGWHLLGTALEALYQPLRREPFLVRPGDQVRFTPAGAGSLPADPASLRLLPPEPSRPLLTVLEPGLLDLVVDAGRFRMGRFGLARSGPLDAWSAGLANSLIGNEATATALEMNLSGPVLEARRAGIAGCAGWGMQPLLNGRALDCITVIHFAAGDTIRFRALPYGARAYLALPGGIESERFAGSASVDLRAGLGRALAHGDVLGSVTEGDNAPRRPVASAMVVSPGPDPVPIRILPGPQASAEALAVLCDAPFVVRAADRMGVRLTGAAVPGGEVLSEATGLGAVQVAPNGDPMVLLVDRGTLGGYAKPALVDPRDLPRVGQLLPGRRVQFWRSPDAAAV